MTICGRALVAKLKLRQYNEHELKQYNVRDMGRAKVGKEKLMLTNNKELAGDERLMVFCVSVWNNMLCAAPYSMAVMSVHVIYTTGIYAFLII